VPEIDGITEAAPITSVEAVSLRSLPASLIIVGGGPVGCEFTQLFSTFGVQVTVLQRAKTLLPHDEPELSQIVQESLEENGVGVLLEVNVERFAKEDERKTVFARVHGQVRQFTVGEILIATGREPRTSELNLVHTDVETENGQVKINDYLQTTRPHIYAGGDVSGPFFYTHFAHYQGALAGLNMFANEPHKAEYSVVPRVTFTEFLVSTRTAGKLTDCLHSRQVRLSKDPWCRRGYFDLVRQNIEKTRCGDGSRRPCLHGQRRNQPQLLLRRPAGCLNCQAVEDRGNVSPERRAICSLRQVAIRDGSLEPLPEQRHN
jgi:hypothetical protein